VRGSIGQILLQRGVIDASALTDVLARQSGRHPVASELYTLGYASERELCLALSAQTGWAAVVFDESVIRLDVLEHVSFEWARIFNALVVYEDQQTLVVAAARPEDAIVPARELAAARGKQVELRIALDITLARTIRVAFRRWKAGELHLVGAEVDRTNPALVVVHPDGGEDEHRRAQRALAEEAARNIESDADLPSEEIGVGALGSEWGPNTITNADELIPAEDSTLVIAAELDQGKDTLDQSGQSGGRTRALVVDPDPPNRTQMVLELERLGYECQAAATGSQATDLLGNLAFDVVFADVATPARYPTRCCSSTARTGTSRSRSTCAGCTACCASCRPRSESTTRGCSPTRSAATTPATSTARSRGCAGRWSAIPRARSCTSCWPTCSSARRAGPRPSTSTRPWSSSSPRTSRR
jgi:CheY-like chemotaxis protein